MARIRTVKPAFFRHEVLQDLETANPGLYPMLFFAGLWTVCDKNGVFEWRPRQIKLDILPFLQNSPDASLMLLRENGLIKTMLHGEKQYGWIPSFREHQRISGKEAQDAPLYPQPSEMTEIEYRGSNGEATGKQQGCLEGKGRGREEEEEMSICTERSPERSVRPIISIILNSKALHPITQADIDDWQTLFPAVDVLTELRKMVAWADANPQRRKTDKGIRRFIVAWLSKEQDKGHKVPAVAEKVQHHGAAYKLAPDLMAEDKP